jgi:hypothetical protein
MTAVRFVLIAALAAAATTALAQPAQAPPMRSGPAPYDTGMVAPNPFYLSNEMLGVRDKACFDGKFLSGANRIGDKVVLLQSARSDVFRVELKQPCPAIEAARKLRVRSEGSDRVCDGGRAQIVATTPAGVQRCSVDEVRALTDREVATLSAAPRR